MLKQVCPDTKRTTGTASSCRAKPLIIEWLHREALAVLSDGVAKKRFAAQGLEPIGDTPVEFAQYLRHEAAKWGKLIKTAGIKPE